MNKTHIATSGIGSGMVVLGISLFLPHWNLTPDQMAYLVGALPAVAMGILAGLQVIFPKTKAVIAAVEAATAPGSAGV